MQRTAWGTYSTDFWNFYESSATAAVKEYQNEDEARRAISSINKIKRLKGIKEVQAKRFGRILYMGREDGRGSHDSGQGVLVKRLEELDAMIKPLEDEYRRTMALLMEIGGKDAGRDIARS